MQFYIDPAKHAHAKFQLSSLYPDGHRQIFDLISRKIQDFLEENSELSKSEKNMNRDFQKASFTKFFAIYSIFESFQNCLLNFLTPEF
jgi:hypothetical protein